MPIRLAIEGCDTFRVSVGTGGASHAIEVAPGRDAFVADVPVDWIRGDDGDCLRGADQPVSSVARIDVTCGDAGRTTSAAFEVSYATADVVLDAWTGWPGWVVRYLYPGGDRPYPWALVPLDQFASPLFSSYTMPHGPPFDRVDLYIDAQKYLLDPLDRPRLVTTADAVFVTSGCSNPSFCVPIEVAPGVLAPSEEIHALGLAQFDFWHVYVPANVTDIAPLPDGDLLVVSHFDAYGGVRDTVVSRLTLTPWTDARRMPVPAGTVEIVGYFPDEIVQTQLSRTADGRLAFVSHQHSTTYSSPPFSAFLNVTDGHTIERTSDVTAGVPPGDVVADVLLSPDGSTMLLGWWLGPTGARTWTKLPLKQGPVLHDAFDGAGAVWGADSLGLWQGAAIGRASDVNVGWVETFGLAPPHDRVFRYDVAPLRGASGYATLHGAAAVGDHFVLTTNTGVRVLDRAGNVVGGADPLPCRIGPTAVAIASGPQQAAVGTAENVLLFDLSKL